jgi:hypothetical protein
MPKTHLVQSPRTRFRSCRISSSALERKCLPLLGKEGFWTSKKLFSDCLKVQVQQDVKRPSSVLVLPPKPYFSVYFLWTVLTRAGALSAFESDAQFGQLMSLIHQMLVIAKSDEKVRTLVSLLQALCRSDVSGDVTTAATVGSANPSSARTAGFAAHAIRHKSRFGGYIKGLEIKVQECVDSGDEDETREAGLAVLPPQKKTIKISFVC